MSAELFKVQQKQPLVVVCWCTKTIKRDVIMGTSLDPKRLVGRCSNCKKLHYLNVKAEEPKAL